MKRTRTIRNFVITIPRVVIEGRIIQLKIPVTKVIIEDLGPSKGAAVRSGFPAGLGSVTGEIERGSIDSDE